MVKTFIFDVYFSFVAVLISLRYE